MGQTKIPNNLLANGAITDLKRLKGLVTNAALCPASSSWPAGSTRPTVARQGDVPKGLLQVTVKLDPERALGGTSEGG